MALSAKAFVTMMSAALAVASTTLAPVATATGMKLGNYEVLNDRWNDHVWFCWVTYSCGAPPAAAPTMRTHSWLLPPGH